MSNNGLDYNDLKVRTDEIKQIITDDANSSTTYIGRAVDFFTQSSDPSWQIQRILKTGNITTKTFADSGKYTQIWDNRGTSFPAASFFNNVSTQFDGVNDYINFGNIFNFEHSQQWSFSCWLKPDNFASTRHFYSKATNDANVYGYGFRINTSGTIDVQMRAPGQLQLTTFTLPLIAGQWSHVVLTYNGGSNLNGWRVYVNNSLDPFTPPSASFAASILSGQNAIIGARNTALVFSGFIDEVSVWDKSLAVSEVSEIYNGGQPDDVRLYSFSSSLSSFYRLGDNDSYPLVLDNESTNNGTMTNMTAGSFVLDTP